MYSILCILNFNDTLIRTANPIVKTRSKRDVSCQSGEQYQCHFNEIFLRPYMKLGSTNCATYLPTNYDCYVMKTTRRRKLKRQPAQLTDLPQHMRCNYNDSDACWDILKHFVMDNDTCYLHALDMHENVLTNHRFTPNKGHRIFNNLWTTFNSAKILVFIVCDNPLTDVSSEFLISLQPSNKQYSTTSVTMLLVNELSRYDYYHGFPGTNRLVTHHNIQVLDYYLYQNTGKQQLISELYDDILNVPKHQNAADNFDIMECLHSISSVIRFNSRHSESQVLPFICHALKHRGINAIEEQHITLLLQLFRFVNSYNSFTVSIFNITSLSNTISDETLHHFMKTHDENNAAIITSISGVNDPVAIRDSMYATLTEHNPLLLIVPPYFSNSTQRESFVDNFTDNTDKLITSYDLYRTIVDISHRTAALNSTEGLPQNNWYSLLDSLPSRTCQQANVLYPVVCLCQGGIVHFNNDTIQAGIADFAISEVQSYLQHQHKYCKHNIHAHSFDDVTVSARDHVIITCMMLYLQVDVHSDSRHSSIVIYKVCVHKVYKCKTFFLQLGDLVSTTSSSLRSYHSTASQLHTTGDANHFRLLCSSTPGPFLTPDSQRQTMLRDLSTKQFGIHPLVVYLDSMCVVLLIRDYTHSVSLRVANTCNKTCHVTLDVYTLNMVTSTSACVARPCPVARSMFYGNSLVNCPAYDSGDIKTTSCDTDVQDVPKHLHYRYDIVLEAFNYEFVTSLVPVSYSNVISTWTYRKDIRCEK